MEKLFFLITLTVNVFAGKSVKECQWNGTVSALEENCTKIVGSPITIGSTDELSVLYTKLAWVEEINGCVQISGTPFARLDFFARLRTVTCTNASYPVDFMVSNNTELQRLGMPFLKVSRLGLTSNQLLCLTRNEATRYSNVQRGATDNITLCHGVNGELKECTSVSNSIDGGLPDNCEVILGNLYIEGSSNLNIAGKVQDIKEVNGRIYIRSTDLNNLTMPMLEKVYAGEPTLTTTVDPTIYISNNSNFTILEIPKINFMAKNDYSFLSTGAEYNMTEDLTNQLAPFGTVMANGEVFYSSDGPFNRLLPIPILLIIAHFFL